MRIAVKCSGGYAGQEQTGAIDTQAAAAAEATQLVALVERARFFDRPVPAADEIGADLQKCSITVTDGGRERTITFVQGGSGDTAALSALANAVLQRG